MTKKDKRKSERPNEALKYSGIAIKMAILIGAGVYGGMKLDERSSMDFPLWTLLLSIIAVFLAIYQIIKDI